MTNVVAPLGGYRQRIRSNLLRVMPHLPKEEIERIVREVPRNMGFTLIEIFSGKEFCSRLKFEDLKGPGVRAIENANETGRPVLLVTGGGIGNVVDAAYMNLALFRQEAAEVRAVLANKIIPDKREKVLQYLALAFAREPFKVIGGFNYQPILANPTLRRISQVLDIELQGSPESAGQIVHHVQIGAASTQRVTEMLQESSLLIVTSSRDELLVTLANIYNIPEYHHLLAGLLIPGVAQVSSITQKILDRSGIPYMRTSRTTAEVFNIINEDVSKLNAKDTQKIDLIKELADKRFNFDAIDELLG